jgi:ribosomal protein S18 acetylase RimI-like enzyme
MIPVQIRAALPRDQSILREMLYHALYVAPGREAFSPDIVDRPELARYVSNWGGEGDLGLIASDAETSEVFGAAWVRLLRGENRGYGYVDDDTAELCIAVVPQQRNKQIGTELLTQLFRMVQQHYSAISLSVAAENPAMHLYQRLGFQTVSNHAGAVVMKKRFHGI